MLANAAAGAEIDVNQGSVDLLVPDHGFSTERAFFKTYFALALVEAKAAHRIERSFAHSNHLGLYNLEGTGRTGGGTGHIIAQVAGGFGRIYKR